MQNPSQVHFPFHRKARIFLLMSLLALFLNACATQPESGSDVPGFLSGLLHGFLIFFSLIGSLFMDIRIYAYPNSGWLYDLGFFIGAMAVLGGGGAGANKKKKKKNRESKVEKENDEEHD